MKLLICTCLSLAVLPLPPTAGSAPQEGAPDMAAMMKQAQRYTQPGEQHKLLGRFLGKWDTQTRLFHGDQALPDEQGSAEFTWRMTGRWLESSWSGTLMGTPLSGALWLGYDNFKQSFVMTTINTMDTAMNRAEGDLSRDGQSLVMYGQMDEYLTGEHDKMVKYAWRFLGPDKLALEVHDLHIGETGSKVVEIVYTRAK